jgi:O-Antigen ligase
MFLIIILNILSVGALLWVGMRKGFPQTLPVAAFLLAIFPEESNIPIPGLFDATTRRIIIITLLCLSVFGRKPDRAGPRRLPLGWIVIALTVWWGVSTADSIVFPVSFKASISQVLDYLMIYYLVAKHVRDTDTAKKIVFGMVAGLVVCSFFGTLEAYCEWTVSSLFPAAEHRFQTSGTLYVDQARGLRVQSTFGHPILFGSALAMTIPMSLYLVTETRRKWGNLFLWAGILLQFVCIYKAGSRGPWIALALSLSILLCLGKKNIRRPLLLIFVLTVTVLITRPGVVETIWNDYMATMDSDSYQGGSYQYRYVLYSLAFQELDRSVPRALWGYGPESFYFLGLSGEVNGRPMAFASCDSSFAALLIETGYIGFGIVVLLLVLGLIRTLRGYWRVPSPHNQLCAVFLANIVAFCFMMSNVAIFRWGQQTVLFWIVLALAMVYPQLVKAERRGRYYAAPARAVARSQSPSLVV